MHQAVSPSVVQELWVARRVIREKSDQRSPVASDCVVAQPWRYKHGEQNDSAEIHSTPDGKTLRTRRE
jgi:hypothetical protein